jgi:hypothetical protein
MAPAEIDRQRAEAGAMTLDQATVAALEHDADRAAE